MVSGDKTPGATFPINATWTYSCSTNLSATHTNTVTAVGWGNGLSAIDIANATVVVGLPIVPPLIHVTKVPSPIALPAGGGAVTYTYTITNPGTVPLSNVAIADDKCIGLPLQFSGHPGDLNKNSLLDTNETWHFTCQANLTRTTANVATASGMANGITAKDMAIATVVVAGPALPNTGFPIDGNNTLWMVIIGAALVLATILVIRKIKI
jgi:hypothetical protein